MNVSVGERWEKWIEAMLDEGRYGSASEVVREGLRLVEEREQKLAALRETIQTSLARGGSYTSEDVRQHVRESLDTRRTGKKAA